MDLRRVVRCHTRAVEQLPQQGDATAVLIEHLKKGDMAREAERLLEGTGWLPEPLRLPVAESDECDVAELPAFLDEDEQNPMAIAAE